MYRFATVVLTALTTSLPAVAKTTIPPGPVGVMQVTPGVHMTLSGGRVGVGASIDALGGVVFGPRYFTTSPGVVGGPFVEINTVLSEGTTLTWGGRAGAGALAPMAVGFLTAGLATSEHGRSRGARTGTRRGLRLRSVAFGAAVNWYDEGPKVWTAGIEAPILPLPLVRDYALPASRPEVVSEGMAEASE